MRYIWPLLTAGVLAQGAAYKVPENSINSMALSAAYTAGAEGADAAYYNPANMAFNDDRHHAELDLTYIGLVSVHFDGSAPTAGSGVTDASGSRSMHETFFVPSVFYSSADYGGLRFGFSALSPAGLSKRWETQPAKGYANEFTLKTGEFNPTVAYRIDETLAIGAGVRMIYSMGEVKSAATASREMSGSGLDFGYNLAVAWRPVSALKLALVYRSEVQLNVTGDATLYYPDDGNYGGNVWYDDAGKVSVPIPAMLQAAVAYTFNARTAYATTLEFVFHRDFWSAYEQLDFDYPQSLGTLTSAFDDPIPRNWHDANAFRGGVTQQIGDLSLMAGGAFDATPVPEETLNFELPDNDGWMASVGARYRFSPDLSVGFGVLYSKKYDRTVSSVNQNGIDGTFTHASATLATAGCSFRF